MSRDSTALGDRMKDYEAVTRHLLPRRAWTILRLDGRHFHSWTRGMQRPFDQKLADAIDNTATALCEQVSGVVFGYAQSDEISLLVTVFAKPGTQPWFGGNVQKITSISASIATGIFNRQFTDRGIAQFDARVFTVPDPVEAANYFIWRQRDAVRNSISMAAQAVFPHRQLQGVSTGQMQDMLHGEGINWNDYDPRFKRGCQVVKCSGPREVTYTDKRTGEPNRITVDRSWWQPEPADHFICELLASQFRDPKGNQ